jgi:hypothetical protein
VDTWYPQVYGSNQPVLQKNFNVQDAEFSTVLWMLDLFFPHHTAPLPLKTSLFNKSQIFTLSLSLSPIA